MNTKSNSRSHKSRISNRRILFVAFAAFALLALFASTPRWSPNLRVDAAMAAAPLSGAIYTSLGDGTAVNHNIYDAKEDVYLNGGPQNLHGSGLPDGTYYFEVTDPSGANLLSEDPAICRQLTVTGGKVSGTASPCAAPHDHPNGTLNSSNGSTPVQLIPFANTPNSGGEYKVYLIRQDTGATIAPDGNHITRGADDDKSDNFKVKESVGDLGCLLAAPLDANLGCNPQNIPECDTSAVTVNGEIKPGSLKCEPADPAPVPGGCVHTRTLKYSATGLDGFECSDTQIITWTEDTTGPTLSNLPTGGNLGCNPESVPDDSSFPLVTASDGCSGDAAVKVSHSDATDGCVTTRKFTFSATDACNVTSTKDVSYSWSVDLTKPTFSGLPTGADLGCNPSTVPDDSSFGGVTASDTCSGSVPVSVSHSDSVVDCVTTRTFTVSATDACTNNATAQVAYSWKVDLAGPTINGVGGPATVYCPSAPTFSTPTASDGCGDARITGYVDNRVDRSCGTYAVTRTWTAVDNCSNSTKASQTIVVECNNCGEGTQGFWQNKNGQDVIKSAGPSSGTCNLTPALRAYLPFQDLSATASCSQVATYVTNVVKAASSAGAAMNPMLKSQMLSTALNVYFSKVNGGAPIDLTYINKTIGSTSYENVSSSFGGASCMTVNGMLNFAAGKSNIGGSSWYGQVKSGPGSQELAKDAFDAINNQKAFSVFSCP